MRSKKHEILASAAYKSQGQAKNSKEKIWSIQKGDENVHAWNFEMFCKVGVQIRDMVLKIACI